MNNDLPSVYANKIDKEINNTQEVYYENRGSLTNKDNRSVKRKINDIFTSPNFVYKKDVKIVTDKGILYKTIVGINNNHILTMDNEVVNIDEIIDIEVN